MKRQLDDAELAIPKKTREECGLMDMPNEILDMIIRFVQWREPLFNTCKRLAAFSVPMTARDAKDLQMWFCEIYSLLYPSSHTPILSKKQFLDKFDEFHLAIQLAGYMPINRHWPIIKKWAPHLICNVFPMCMGIEEQEMWNLLLTTKTQPFVFSTYVGLHERIRFVHPRIEVDNMYVRAVFYEGRCQEFRNVFLVKCCKHNAYWHGLALCGILESDPIKF